VILNEEAVRTLLHSPPQDGNWILKFQH